MHPTIRTRLIIVLIVAALVAIVWHNGFKEHATLSNLQDNIKHLEQFVQTHYLKSVLMYIGAYATEVILVLPLSALLTLTSGFFVWGSSRRCVYHSWCYDWCNDFILIGAILIWSYFAKKICHTISSIQCGCRATRMVVFDDDEVYFCYPLLCH